MDTRTALLQAQEAGTAISFIAKNIGKDPSTVHKWMRGTNKYLSEATEKDVINELRRIKQLWEKIDV